MIRSGVKPQDKVTQKGFRRIEQALTDVDERKYSPEKDILPVKDVNLGSEKNRFKTIYAEDGVFSANSIKIGRITLSQDLEGDRLVVKNKDGVVVASTNESLNKVEEDMSYTDTTTSAYAIGTCSVDAELSVADGAEFIVI